MTFSWDFHNIAVHSVGKLFSKTVTIFRSSSKAPSLRKIGKFKISVNLEIMQIRALSKRSYEKTKCSLCVCDEVISKSSVATIFVTNLETLLCVSLSPLLIWVLQSSQCSKTHVAQHWGRRCSWRWHF